MALSDAAAVLSVLDRFRAGWEGLDAEAVLDCFAHDAKVVVIGTDAGEYWRGFDALVDPFRAMVGAFTEPVYRWIDPPHIEVLGEVAWADAPLEAALTADSGRMVVVMRTSWVLRHRERWEVVQAHFSVAPPSPVAAY